jgi:renalase
MLNIQSCIIVGAGISGLIAAHKLREYHIPVKILDKGRGPGGRMARKVWNDSVFDHGAQFITTRDKAFRDRVDDWRQAGVVKPWYTGPLGNMRYVGVDGMTAIPQHLAVGLDVSYSHKVTSIHFTKNEWAVTAEAHGSAEPVVHRANFLIITAPVPQALQLIESSNIELDYDEEEELRRIQYQKSLAVLVRLKGPSGLPNPGAMDLNHEVLRYLGDNFMKGITPVPGSVTLHSSPRFAEYYWNRSDDERIPAMLAAARPFLKSDPAEAVCHRWAYNEPVRIYKEKQPFRVPYFLDDDRRLAMCGDGFGGPRIEASALSGLAMAERLVKPY